MIITLNLDLPVLSLAKTPIPNSHLGQVLAEALAMSADGKLPPLKIWGWATRLFEKQPLVLDECDAAFLETFVANHPGLVVMVKAQILPFFKSHE